MNAIAVIPFYDTDFYGFMNVITTHGNIDVVRINIKYASEKQFLVKMSKCN